MTPGAAVSPAAGYGNAAPQPRPPRRGTPTAPDEVGIESGARIHFSCGVKSPIEG